MKKFLIILFCSGLSMSSQAQNVVQGEYFIDTDLGVGNNTQVTFTPSSDNSFPFTINLSGYAPGYHKLYIRTKDSDGNWSFTSRRNVEVFTPDVKTSLTSGEYFIDNDPGVGMGSLISISDPDSIILQNFNAVASGLPEGYHKLYGRFKDSFGRWSLTFRRNMEVYKDVNSKVINGEYFFKTDYGFGDCTPVTFAAPSADGSFVINIPLNTIPSGSDTLFVRVHDNIESRWSTTQILSNLKALPLTLLSFSAKKEFNTAQLHWQTVNEVNTSHFNIQRSLDGTNFTTIGEVNARMSSSLEYDYTYTDNVSNLNPGKIFYRLQMLDNDGKFTFSNIVYINKEDNDLLISVHPNPAHDYFVIRGYDRTTIRNSTIYVRDLSGRTLISLKLGNNTEQKVNISSLAKGMYLVNIVTGGKTQTKKLIIE